jgi:hypothetical protein
LQVNAAGVPGGDLHANIAEAFGPLANGLQVVEWRLVSHELGQENSGSFDCFHFIGQYKF